MVVNVAILKSHGINRTFDAVKYVVPFLFMFFQRNGFVFGKYAACGHHGFFTINPGANERGQVLAYGFALGSQGLKGFNGALGFTAYLGADVPAAKCFSMPVVLPHFVNYVSVGIYFRLHVAGIPIVTTVVKTKIKPHVVFFGQRQKQVYQIYGWPVTATALHQISRWVG